MSRAGILRPFRVCYAVPQDMRWSDLNNTVLARRYPRHFFHSDVTCAEALHAGAAYSAADTLRVWVFGLAPQHPFVNFLMVLLCAETV